MQIKVCICAGEDPSGKSVFLTCPRPRMVRCSTVVSSSRELMSAMSLNLDAVAVVGHVVMNDDSPTMS